MSLTRKIYILLKQTFKELIHDNVPKQAAALSFYTVFALAPLLLILLKILGIVWETTKVKGLLIAQFRELLGGLGTDAIVTIMSNAGKDDSGTFSAIVGVVALLFAATGVIVELKDALNTVWEIPENNNQSGIVSFLLNRVLSLTMILAIGFLLMVSLMVSLMVNTALTASIEYFGFFSEKSGFVISLINNLVSIGAFTLLFAAMFKFLPDRSPSWRDVWLGAFITSILFTLGKYLIGLYLGNSSSIGVYGAAGSLAVLFLWIYYSAQIFFIGAEFTQVFSKRKDLFNNSITMPSH